MFIFFLKKLTIFVNKHDKSFLIMRWFDKVHKTLIGSCLGFTVPCKICITKPYITVSNVFKLINNYVQNLYNINRFYSSFTEVKDTQNCVPLANTFNKRYIRKKVIEIQHLNSGYSRQLLFLTFFLFNFFQKLLVSFTG